MCRLPNTTSVAKSNVPAYILNKYILKYSLLLFALDRGEKKKKETTKQQEYYVYDYVI